MRVFVGIVLGMFGIGVMQLVLATAMPFIVREIGGDYLYGWVFSSYMLASLLTIPVFSKLADLYGKRRYYLLGMAIFGLGTLYGGLAPSMEHLIAARVVQGLGAGLMIPVSLALVSDLFPAERRAHMIGAFSLVQILANLISPVLGSFITRQLGWHWIFLLTLGAIVAAIGLVASDKPEARRNQPARWSEIDFFGGVLFGIFCVLAVLASDSISKLGGLDFVAASLLVGALVSALVLAWNEHRHGDPIIKVGFFRAKVLRRSIVSSLVAGGIMYGLVTILPLCGVVLGRQGFSVDESQTLMVFMLGTTFGLLLASRLVMKLQSALPRISWGISVVVAGSAYYAVSANNLVLLNVVTGLLGLALGGIMATVLINSQNAVSSGDRTVLSGLVQLSRYLGAAVGVTILTGVLPSANQISGAEQFLGVFGLLVAMYLAGLLNELV